MSVELGIDSTGFYCESECRMNGTFNPHLLMSPIKRLIGANASAFQCYLPYMCRLRYTAMQKVNWPPPPSPGPETAAGCVGEKTDVHYWNISHHGGHRHCGLERDTPQDWELLQPLGARIPRPQLPGQCPNGALSAGSHRVWLGACHLWWESLENYIMIADCCILSARSVYLADTWNHNEEHVSPPACYLLL